MNLFTSTCIFFSLGFILLGCGSKQVSKADLAAYLGKESTGLVSGKEIEEMQVSFHYKPKDLVIQQEIEGHNYSPNEIDSIRNLYKEIDYFTLKMSYNGEELANNSVSDPALFTSVVEYFNSQIGNDIKLIHESDTLTVEDFLYFRGSTQSEVLLAFKSNLTERKGNFEILYDLHFFNRGLNKFEFETETIKSIPSIALN